MNIYFFEYYYLSTIIYIIILLLSDITFNVESIILYYSFHTKCYNDFS